MDLKKRFATDKALEDGGAWVDLGEGASIKVARVGNKNYNQLFQRRVKQSRINLNINPLPEDVSQKFEAIIVEAMAETILLGWNGMQEDGVEIPYSKENAIKLLTDYKDFRDIVVEHAKNMDTFRSQEIADTEKNSKKRSTGN